ncbi:MAG: glycosyltransferase [Alphaproteobacteria bacterium]|nr:glycosyltransferase [Alphaproteobacteria bacterium]
MRTQDVISVIIVTFHTGPALFRAIDSVLNQGGAFELVVVNNGNPRDVEDHLIARFKTDPKVRLMTGHGAIGLARGCNLGARVAQGTKLLFLSPYAILPAKTLERLLQTDQEQDGTFILGGRLVDKKGRLLNETCRPLITPKTILKGIWGQPFRAPAALRKALAGKDPVEVPALSRAFLFVRSKDFKTLGGFDERFKLHAGVMDFCVRFKEQLKGTILVLPALTVRLGKMHEHTSFMREKAKISDIRLYLRLHVTGIFRGLWLGLADLSLGIRFLLRLLRLTACGKLRFNLPE